MRESKQTVVGCRRAAAVSLAILIIAGNVASAGDWPGWRGPARDGHSPDTGLLPSWPDGGPPLAWRASGFGGGFSSVAVVGERIYTMGDLGDAQYVIAAKRADGDILWKTRVAPAWKDRYLGPRSTPTVDADRVYVVTTEGDVVCLKAATGEMVWKRSLPGDFGGKMMRYAGAHEWKFSESPLVDGERLIVTPGVPDAALVALDKLTGKEIWRTTIPALGEKGDDGAGYSSVVVSHGAGVRQYVQFIGRGVIGVETDSGKFLWGYNRIANQTANIATPLIEGDHVFASSGYETGSVLLQLSGNEERVSVEEAYFLEPNVLQNHHGGLILHDGYVYTGTGHNKGFPIAVEMKSGKVAWGPQRTEGKDSSALVYADGRLYFRFQNGLMVLAEATHEGYRERGSFMIPDVKLQSWTQPVIIGGMMYLREQDNLFCYDVRVPGDD
jgi:outer membrane protein assembly factor BamB